MLGLDPLDEHLQGHVLVAGDHEPAADRLARGELPFDLHAKPRPELLGDR